VPTYNPDTPEYSSRAHQNGRDSNPDFDPEERLYRRYPERGLVGGKPTPLRGFDFEDMYGHSVNRATYSEPADVLEPDCCDGSYREGYVVLDFSVSDVPAEIPVRDEPWRIYFFRMKHDPQITCFAHSEIWCNESGDLKDPYVRPPKTVRDLFRATLCARILRPPLRFNPIEPPESSGESRS
jgi:hypothetical protein